MRDSWGKAFVAAILLLLICSAGPSPNAGSLEQALKDGKVDVDIRFRFETVDQQGFPEDAEAATTRLRLGYGTADYHGFTAYIDFEVIRAHSDEDYNSTQNGMSQYPTIADPEDEELNQAFLAYAAPKETKIKAGRQRIVLDNHRFVGNVGWRQNEQTFDALTVTSEPLEGFKLFGAHLENANRIFGQHNPDPAKANTELNAQLLSASYEFKPGTLTAYGHQLEFEKAPAASHRNFGLRFAGKHSFGEKLDLLYTGEFAEQSDYEMAPSTVDAGYRFAELGVGQKYVTVKVGLEVLEGDGMYGFQTPLATLHKFNGWTDRFLSTPSAGLEDLYVTAAGKAGDYQLLGVYHDFSADSGGGDYGTELGLQVSRAYEYFSWSVKYADYNSDFMPVGTPPAYALDTKILWFTVQLKI